MTAEFNWYLPTEGDARGREPQDPTRAPAHWANLARAVEYAGFHALMIPTGSYRPDAWLVAAALARQTTRLKFLVALRPGFVLPAVAAESAASLQQLSNQRLLLNVVTGGGPTQHLAYGDPINHDDRYERAAEFLGIVKQVWKGRPAGQGFQHRGRHYRIDEGGLHRPLRQAPPLYLGGASRTWERVAAVHADVYYPWAEPPQALRERILRLRDDAASAGRTLRIGCRVHLIARPTQERAWAEAARLLAQASPASPPARSLEISPGLWSGARWLRGDPGASSGTGWVGSYAQIAERIHEAQALGVDSFLFSAPSGLEDALRISEEVLPLLRPAIEGSATR